MLANCCLDYIRAQITRSKQFLVSKLGTIPRVKSRRSNVNADAHEHAYLSLSWRDKKLQLFRTCQFPAIVQF